MRGFVIVIALTACSGKVGSSSQQPDAAGTTTGDGAPTTDAPPFASGIEPYFTTHMFWNRDVSATPKASDSDSIIGALRAAGGWGNGDVFQIDYALDVLT